MLTTKLHLLIWKVSERGDQNVNGWPMRQSTVPPCCKRIFHQSLLSLNWQKLVRNKMTLPIWLVLLWIGSIHHRSSCLGKMISCRRFSAVSFPTRSWSMPAQWSETFADPLQHAMPESVPAAVAPVEFNVLKCIRNLADMDFVQGPWEETHECPGESEVCPWD